MSTIHNKQPKPPRKHSCKDRRLRECFKKPSLMQAYLQHRTIGIVHPYLKFDYVIILIYSY